MTGLEPAASGVTVRYLRVMQGKLVAFVLNTAHRLPPIPTQKLEQTGTISCSVPSCCFYQLCHYLFSFSPLNKIIFSLIHIASDNEGVSDPYCGHLAAFAHNHEPSHLPNVTDRINLWQVQGKNPVRHKLQLLLHQYS